MKTNLKLFSLLLAGASLYSCDQNSAENQSIKSEKISLEWEILDSLDLEYLGQPVLADVNETAGKVVFYEYTGQDLLITDLEGNIESKFSKSGDTPDAYGFMMSLPGFYNENEISMHGMNGFFLYDLEGNMTKKVKHPEAPGAVAFMAQIGKTSERTTINGKDYILTKSTRSRDTYPGEEIYYEKFRAIEVIDPETETVNDIVPFEEGSIFLNGMGYIKSDYMPAFEADGNVLFSAMGGEPILYKYTITENSATLDTAVNLSIPEFQKIEGKELASFSKGSVAVTSVTPSIRNIHIVGDKLLVAYYSGMSDDQLKELEGYYNQGNQEEAEERYYALEKKVKRGVLVFDKNSLELLGELAMPEEAKSINFVSGDEYLWMVRAAPEDVEEDFLRVYKVGLNAD